MSSPNPQELAQLRDIHLPDAISWWPLAPGWYLLFILVLVMVLIISMRFTNYYLNGRAKRHALRLVDAYLQEYRTHGNAQLSAARLSELLKRVALVYFPRKNVAGLQGEAWIAFLNSTSKALDFYNVRNELLHMPYQPAITGDLHLLFTMTRTWIKQRRGVCLN